MWEHLFVEHIHTTGIVIGGTIGMIYASITAFINQSKDA